MELISVQVCVDPTEIGWLCARGLRDCQRCGYQNEIAALLKFPELPDSDDVALCADCYGELAKTGLATAV
jgi:hypothetical protein